MRHETAELVGHGGERLHSQCWLPDGEVTALAVLAHGLAEHGGRYGTLAARLTERGFALHVCDMRGHGRSAGVRSYVGSFESVVGDLACQLEAARARHPRRPLTLIGHSFGGAVALMAAL